MMIGIIEDDRLLNQALNKMLTDKGYDTTCAHSREEALVLSADRIDLFLIDIGLPDGDGLKLYRELKAEKDVPAIFLTARDEEQDMLTAFETGADDYVVKPFSMKVLLKRIEVVLKRNKEGDILTCGDITLYPEKKQVFSDAEEISLCFYPLHYPPLQREESQGTFDLLGGHQRERRDHVLLHRRAPGFLRSGGSRGAERSVLVGISRKGEA